MYKVKAEFSVSSRFNCPYRQISMVVFCNHKSKLKKGTFLCPDNDLESQSGLVNNVDPKKPFPPECPLLKLKPVFDKEIGNLEDRGQNSSPSSSVVYLDDTEE